MKKRMMILLFLVLSGVSNVNAVDLVKDSKAVSSIVIAPKPTKGAQFAALELQYHIKKITGVTIPVTSKIETVTGMPVFVGESPETIKLGLKNKDFGNQEYLLEVDKDKIILMGKDAEDYAKVDYYNHSTFPGQYSEFASACAVYDFLERLGVRWYLPTDVGIVLPDGKDLAISEIKVRRAPAMKYRTVSNASYPADFMTVTTPEQVPVKIMNSRDVLLFLMRSRVGGANGIINHSLYLYYDRFLPQHPKWFAQGYPLSKSSQLCYSNPEVVAQVIQDGRDFFDGKVDAAKIISSVPAGYKSDIFPVCFMDNNFWCKCAGCQVQLKTNSACAGQFSNDKASNYFFGFANKIAKELKKSHPGKFVGVFGYADCTSPPDNIKLEDNIILCLTMAKRMPYAASNYDNENRIFAQWNKEYPGNEKIVWMWYCFPVYTGMNYQYRVFPGFFASRVKDFMGDFNKNHVTGLFIEPSYMQGGAVAVLFDQLDLYLTWKLADDPSLDGDKLFNDFFTLYYGKAAGPMKKFYQLVESIYCNPENYPPNTLHQTQDIAWQSLGTPKRMEELGKLMDEANKLAQADSQLIRKRVAIFDKGVWQYMVQGAKDYQDKNVLLGKTMRQSVAPMLTNKESGNPLTIDWSKASRFQINYDMQGKILPVKYFGQLANDGKYLYIKYEEPDCNIDKLIADTGVFSDDEWETFFAKQRGAPYRQIGISCTGRFQSYSYNGINQNIWETKFKVISERKKDEKLWQIYLSIPLADLAEGGVKPGETIYFNVIRSCNTKYQGSFVPTYGGYHNPKSLGQVYIGK